MILCSYSFKVTKRPVIDICYHIMCFIQVLSGPILFGLNHIGKKTVDFV